MHGEEVPILADSQEQVVEELVEGFSQLVSDINDVCPQLNLVVVDAFSNHAADLRLARTDFTDGSFNLLLYRFVEVKLIE